MPQPALTSQTLSQEAVAGGETSQWLAVGAGLAATALLLLLILTWYFLANRRIESAEERQLRQSITALRNKLGITVSNGFSLTSEHNNLRTMMCLRQQQSVTVLQHSYVEAAARLSLFQDFEVYKLDAFCLCLQCSCPSDQLDSSPIYQALCNWFLELSLDLVRPSLPSADFRENDEAAKLSQRNLSCALPEEQRFPYFLKFVIKCRIWSDSGGTLFERLKGSAQVFAARMLLVTKIVLSPKTAWQECMEEISLLCDERSFSLAAEKGGEALLAFNAPPNDFVGIQTILRQDHPEVLSALHSI